MATQLTQAQIQERATQYKGKATEFAQSLKDQAEGASGIDQWAANGQAWCAGFISKVFGGTGYSALGFDGILGADAMIEHGKAIHSNKTLGDKPPPVGSIVSERSKGHVMLVTAVDGDKVTITHGNYSNKVTQETLSYAEFKKRCDPEYVDAWLMDKYLKEEKKLNLPPLAGGTVAQGMQPAQSGSTPATGQTVPAAPTAEEVAEETKKKGALGAFESLGGENAGGGGIFPMLLFIMVMAAMGKETDKEKSKTAEGRAEQLKQADLELTAPAKQNAPVPAQETASAPTNPALSSLQLPVLSSDISPASAASSVTVSSPPLARTLSPLQLS